VKFSIIHIKAFSGEKANIYTLKYDNKEFSEFQSFSHKFLDSHDEIIQRIAKRIFYISTRDGIQESFFKRESSESHNVFRLRETGPEIRIYCIKYSHIILLFGSGGIKKYKTKKNIENPHLQKEINKLIKIEDAINKKLDSGEIKITDQGFEGNLKGIEL